MEIRIRNDELNILEFNSDNIILNTAQDALDLIGLAGENNSNKIILHENNINPDFFKLATGFAGEILQKFVNYHIKCAIAGDFTKYTSNNLKAFINECNNGNQFFFVANSFEALDRLKRIP